MAQERSGHCRSGTAWAAIDFRQCSNSVVVEPEMAKIPASGTRPGRRNSVETTRLCRIKEQNDED